MILRMLSALIRLTPAIIFGLSGAAVELSGYQNPTLALALFLLAGAWALLVVGIGVARRSPWEIRRKVPAGPRKARDLDKEAVDYGAALGALGQMADPIGNPAAVHMRALSPSDVLARTKSLIARGGHVREEECAFRVPSKREKSARPGSVANVNAWLGDVEELVGFHFSEQAYRVGKALPEDASSASVIGVIDHTMPPLQILKTRLEKK